MSECNHDCSSCKSKCADAATSENPFYVAPNPLSNVKHVIGVVSGKGGVGKSLVTSMLAVTMQRAGYHAAILDADITGPSIPRAFGLKDVEIEGNEYGMFPPKTKTGISVMSLNLLVDEESKPVVWRGPVIAGTVKQFWSEVIWNDVDFMFVDMPPGTGDVPLTVFQSLPLDGIVIVGSPQELVSMIVDKAVNMAKLMNIPILGLVENMSYFECPDCGKKHAIFGESKIEEVSAELGLPVLARLPINTKTANLVDKGAVELAGEDDIKSAVEAIEKYFA